MASLERILFFGTPDFAVPTLEALVAAGWGPLRVITQPSRPVGRGKQLQPPPVARVAGSLGLPLLQPEKVRAPEFLATVAEPRPDLAVVVAFGQIFPRALLELPVHGCINLHASLLPAYRGAAPIQAAVAAGDEVTGVTTMHMEEGLDSGPMLLRRSLPIGPRETAAELSERLARTGAELVVDTLRALEAGELRPQPQDAAQATYAPRIRKQDGEVDWTLPAATLFNRLRAFTPWPGLHASLRDRPVRLVWAEPAAPVPGGEAPGTCLGLRDGALAVRCGDGTVLAVSRLQRPGKQAVSATDFVNGEHLRPGESFAAAAPVDAAAR